MGGLTGGGDNNVKLLAVLALVRRVGGLDAGAPKRALKARHAWWVRAVTTPDRRGGAGISRRVDRRVALGITRHAISSDLGNNWQGEYSHVERSAELSAIAESSALLDIVAVKGEKRKVRLSADTSVQVLEDLRVLSVVDRRHGSRGILSKSMELRVGQESRRSIRAGYRAVAIWLRGARVERVDEAAVGTGLRLGRASARRGGCLGARKGRVRGVAGRQSSVVGSAQSSWA